MKKKLALLFVPFVLFAMTACEGNYEAVNPHGNNKLPPSSKTDGDSSGQGSEGSGGNGGTSGNNGAPSNNSSKKTAFDNDKQELIDHGYTVYAYLSGNDLSFYEEKLDVPKGSLYGYILTYRSNRFDIYYFNSESQASALYKAKKDELNLTLCGWKVIEGAGASDLIDFVLD